MTFYKKIAHNKKCEVCKLTDWNNKEISLKVHHIDGYSFNNELSNIKLLYPNCNAQIDTYRRLNKHIYKNREKDIK